MRFGSLLLSALVVGSAACTASNTPTTETPDSGTQEVVDAGPPPLCKFVNQAQRHESFVPEGTCPPDADRLVVMGDSISDPQGYNVTNPNLAYFNQLLNNTKWADEENTTLPTKFGHDVELVNVAKAGAVTKDLANQYDRLVNRIAGQPGHTIVVMTIGGNDMQVALGTGQSPTGKTLTDALANIRALVDSLRNPDVLPDGVSIYLASVYDPSDGVGRVDSCFGGTDLRPFMEALDVWSEKYVELGKERGIAIVDALHHFKGHGFYAKDKTNQYYDETDPTIWFDSDCVHPNDRGHNQLRRLFFEAIDLNYEAGP